MKEYNVAPVGALVSKPMKKVFGKSSNALTAVALPPSGRGPIIL